MITLYGFGPVFGLPDASPFVVKAMTLLRISGLPFTVDTQGYAKAPKGKLPYLRDGDRVVADSTFIRWHLEQQRGIDFDRHLSAERRGFCWAVERMLENHTYWAAAYERWMVDANLRTYITQLPFVPKLARNALGAAVGKARVARQLNAHGIGRHTRDEIHRRVAPDFAAVAALLGEHDYVGGAKPCGADATVFAFVDGGLCDAFESPMRQMILAHPTLPRYVARMRERYYPELSANSQKES